MSLRVLSLPVVLGLLVGCSSAPAADDPDYELVEDGKADNYRSTAALEFLAHADAEVVLDEADRELADDVRLDKAKELVSAKLLQIGWFLNLWVADKEGEDANVDYGGYNAMARNASVKSLEIEAVDAITYRFNFEATIAAQNDFLSVLPGQKDGAAVVAQLNMARLDNDTLLGGTWQSRFDVHTWKPGEDASALEILPIRVEVAPRSANAYLDYASLWADGKLEVGVQFGWDYNADRSDLANARQLYGALIAAGFTSPVDSYEKLGLDSGPLVREASYGGKQGTISVRLIHPGMVASPSANAAELRAALLDLLATREVVLFNGHAGVSGRLLPADFRSTSAGNIMPTEYPSLKLLPGYQLLLIEGCQTYARFTDGFRQNPLKRGADGQLVNMDIVTSTSYTWTSQGAETMLAILMPLIGTRADAPISPVTWDDVLVTLNEEPNDTSFFGVNGIDNDPHAHPFARRDLLGTKCTSNAACGGEGNRCFKRGTSSKKVCGSICLDDAGCPSGYACKQLATSGTLAQKVCAK
jgi:hypothetical protein